MEKEPDGPYVYQPFGAVTHPDRAKTGRLYGVGGVGGPLDGVRIEGLTKDEAEAVAALLRKGRPL